MDACKFINKFIDNIIQLIYDNDAADPDSSIYKVFKDNNLLLDEYSLDNKKVSEFIINPQNEYKTKELFNLLEENGIFLYYDDCDSSWIGDHLEASQLSVKEKEVSDKIYNKELFRYKEVFEAFEQ